MTAVFLRWRDKARFKGGDRGAWWGPGLTSFDDVKQDRAESAQEPRSSAKTPPRSLFLVSTGLEYARCQFAIVYPLFYEDR